ATSRGSLAWRACCHMPGRGRRQREPRPQADTSVTNLSRDALNIRRVERLAVIGVSHSRGGPEAVAAFQACYRGPLDVARLGFPEAVVVATCNRFEAVVALPPGVSARSARAALPPADGRYEPAFAFAGDAA